MDQKTIETKRLILRPLVDGDATEMTELLNDYEVSKYLAVVPFPYTLADAQSFIQRQREFDPRSLTRAICFKQDSEIMLGVVGYHFRESSSLPQFGYWLGRKHWGQRIMSEASAAMLSHGFNCGVEIFESSYWNPISGKVLSRLGFVEVEQAQQYCRAQGKDVDCVNLELTQAAWASKPK